MLVAHLPGNRLQVHFKYKQPSDLASNNTVLNVNKRKGFENISIDSKQFCQEA
jgi:hypothetical protein